MRLADILQDCRYEIVSNQKSPAVTDVDISGIAYDSRKATEGSVFVAIKGENFDGHNFIDDATTRAAAAIVFEKSEVHSAADRPQSAPVLVHVEDSREALACIANNFCGRPSERIPVIGVTGTNGKTTTTYLIKAILEAWTKSVGLIGTISYIIRDKTLPAQYTTPESPEFQGLLSEMAAGGCDYVVTEVSSHALAQRRVDHTGFIVAVFTNLTRDHLDFHGTMERYYFAKRRLFTELLRGDGTAVINTDDQWGGRLRDELRIADCELRNEESQIGNRKSEMRKVITYGIDKEADVSAVEIRHSFTCTSFDLRYKDNSCRIDSPLVGMPNVYNVLAAASAAVALGVPIEVIRGGIEGAAHIKGRLEAIDAGQDFLCIIDYAHTPDALERLLQTARELMPEIRNPKSEIRNNTSGPRIITVFGCGGDRDHGKRPLMGAIASRLSDYAIITSDNPRSEDPVAIINQIVSGISENNFELVPDRRKAIEKAVEKAGAGDVVIIAGKGHEDYQEIKGKRYKFSDREAAEEAIKIRFERYKTQDV